ncbi:MAG: hypothetical protein ACR5KV_06310 [Wolbachia sp.]
MNDSEEIKFFKWASPAFYIDGFKMIGFSELIFFVALAGYILKFTDVLYEI